MIEIKNLSKKYENAVPLNDVSFNINDGDVISVIGPSGTGKSTLIRCINMLEKPTSGQIIFNGSDITAQGYDIRKARMKMGMVFQSFNLFGHLTVIENLMLAPMDLLGKSKQEAYDKGMELLKRVGMADKALNYPDELSGGQKQRVAIARTLCMDPEVILLDEPTSALDPTMVSEVQAVIRDLSKSGKTMMIVTHEMRLAKKVSNRVMYMDEGVIYEDGTTEQIFEHPVKDKTRRFVRRLKVLELNIESRDFDFVGTESRIDQYCFKNRIPLKLSSGIKVAVEELCLNILMHELEEPKINVAIEYSEKHESAYITTRYPGKFRPDSTDDQIALKVLGSYSSSHEYEYDEESGMSTVIVRIIDE